MWKGRLGLAKVVYVNTSMYAKVHRLLIHAAALEPIFQLNCDQVRIRDFTVVSNERWGPLA